MFDHLFPPLAGVTVGYNTYQAATQATNEDAVGYGSGKMGHVLVVADGVGSDERGRNASLMVVNRIVMDVQNDALWPPPDKALKHSIERANKEMCDIQLLVPEMKGMASTVVAALLHGNILHVGHIGNSRCYFIRGKKMWRLTRDHTLVEDMVKVGTVRPEDALNRPEANVLQKVMGVKPEEEAELLEQPVEMEPGDRIALCTDGILHMVTEREIARMVREMEPQEACNEILGLAYERKSRDDATIAVLRFNGFY